MEPIPTTSQRKQARKWFPSGDTEGVNFFFFWRRKLWVREPCVLLPVWVWIHLMTFPSFRLHTSKVGRSSKTTIFVNGCHITCKRIVDKRNRKRNPENHGKLIGEQTTTSGPLLHTCTAELLIWAPDIQTPGEYWYHYIIKNKKKWIKAFVLWHS